MKHLIQAILTLTIISIPLVAFTKNDNLPNGRPFQILNDKIDAVYLELSGEIEELFAIAESHEERIAACETKIADLQAEIEELEILVANNTRYIEEVEARVETNEIKIELLEEYIYSLEAALEEGCPEGSSIQSYTATGGIVCEFDDSGAESVHSMTVIEDADYNILTGYTGVVECPIGYFVTGGGFRDMGILGISAVVVKVHENYPAGYRSWRVALEADPLHTFKLYAKCLMID